MGNHKTGLLVCALLAGNCLAQPAPGTINTFAGSNAQGFSGDGGPAASAALNQPPFVAIDLSGNVYIADAFNNRIRKVDAAGVITTFAGNGTEAFTGDGGTALSASVNNPIGVSFDLKGNLYIAEPRDQRIRKVDTSGIITTVAGSGSQGFAGDGGPAIAASFYNPVRTVEDSAGNIYIADQSNHRVRKVDARTGIITTIAGNGVGTPANGAFSGDGGPATQASLNNPTALVLDGTGNVYFSDQFNQRVRKIDTNGIITTVAGNGIQGPLGDGGPAVNAQLNFPGGLARDNAGNLYLADDNNFRVRVVNPQGIISTVAGTGMFGFSGDGGPAINATLDNPFGIAVDPLGNLYIADINNNRIRKVTSADTTPGFTIASVANAASFVSGATPGGIVALFGTNLTNISGISSATTTPLPTILGGTSVTVGGVPAPLFAVANLNGSEQINLQIPFEAAGQTSVAVVVNNGVSSSAVVQIPVTETQPGIFTVDGTAAAALHGDLSGVLNASKPAAKGEVIVLFATGLGPVSPAVASGAPTPLSPLTNTTIVPTVTIGGLDAKVSFHGLTPGLVALDQLNVTVPAAVASGNPQVVITSNGIQSKAATIPVQ